MSSNIAGNTTTTANLAIGTTASGSLDFLGDTDWWRVSLTAGFAYQIWVEGASAGMGTLADPYLAIYNSTGAFQHANNDYSFLTFDSYVSTAPNGSGTFYISVEEFGNNAIGSYRVTAWLDQLATTATAATISTNTQITDRIGWQGDTSDWYVITLTAGVNYQFDLIGSARDGLSLALLDGWLALRSSDGSLLVFNDDSGLGTNARIFFTPTVTGQYFLDVQESGSNAVGVYTLIVNQAPVSGSLALGLPGVNGNIDFLADTDLYSISLTAGVTYGFSIDAGTLADPYLELLDHGGGVLTVDDDSGPGLNSRLTYTPTSSGTYYLAARASGNAGIGTYTATAWMLPKVSIADATVTEGNTGTRTLNFGVSLSAPSPIDVTLTAGTRASTASTASGDYQGVYATTLVIPAGATSVNFAIPVNGDQVFEPNEGLRAVLSDPVMAVIDDGEARGWIIDDDAPYALPSDWLLRYQ